jgi:signal transduction histidine kinase/ligand-binding sensor domain-containing protein
MYLFVWVNLVPNLAMAQSYHFKTVAETHGLSDNRVTCFQKDRTGFMWIGTENGLNRYDGHAFKIYRPGQTKFKLSHEHINDIEEDARGHLWVATWHGLNVIDPTNDSLRIFLPDVDDGRQQKTRIASSLVWDSHIDRKGRVWLAVDVRDLCYYDPQQKEFTYLPWQDFVKENLPQYKSVYKSIHKIIAKSDDELWLGTTLGLFSYNIHTQAFRHHGGDAPEDFVSIHYDSIRQLVYFAQRKVYAYDVRNNSFRQIKQSANTTSTNLKSSSSIWLPSLTELWAVDKATEQATILTIGKNNSFTVQHEKVSDVFHDHGITWLGTSAGISIYDSDTDIFPFIQLFPESAQSGMGKTFYVLDQEQDNVYYVSSYAQNSLILLNQQTGVNKEIYTIGTKPLLFCNKMMEDSHHRLWILSAESIFVSDEDRKQFSVFPFPTTADNYRFVDIIEDAEGNFWFASLRKGIFQYHPQKKIWKQIPKDRNALFADRPTVLLSDPAHQAVWIGDFSYGLFRYDLKKKEYAYFRVNTKDKNSIQSSLINALALDRKGDLWIATTSGGLSTYSQDTKKITTYSMETGLPENTIHSIQPDLHGNIWLASSKGLTHIKPTGEIIKHYNENSGLPFSNFSTPFSSNTKGEIMIGGGNGFIKFHPDSLTVTSLDFPIVITSAKQRNLSLDSVAQQKFTYNQNEFDFQFSALTYSLPNQVTYFYRLKGYDKDWINAGNNHSAHYTNLSDGEYTFSVKAIDHSGRWSNQPALVSFSITPPFWRRGWFTALIVTAISTFFYLWIRSLQRKIQSQQILNQLATSLFGQNAIDRVFSTVAKTCGESFLFENCTIYSFNNERRLLISKATFGQKTAYRSKNKSTEIEIGQGMVGAVAQTGIASIHSHPFSEIAVPILIDGKVFAVIAAEQPKKYYYGRWHLSLLKEVATICSVKISKYFAEEQIRSKVARDLHDDLGSALSSINILSQVALVEKNGNAQNYLKRIGDQSARMMEDMGDMVWSINPRNDSMAQVIIRMREFATEIIEPKNITYHFSDNVAEGLTLNADKRKSLFLIFKETVNNAAKYSNATRIEINLLQQDHTLVLRIKDNGQGFDEQMIKAGNGLRNMRERAKEVNGIISVKSAVSQGTEVELRLLIT